MDFKQTLLKELQLNKNQSADMDVPQEVKVQRKCSENPLKARKVCKGRDKQMIEIIRSMNQPRQQKKNPSTPEKLTFLVIVSRITPYNGDNCMRKISLKRLRTRTVLRYTMEIYIERKSQQQS